MERAERYFREALSRRADYGEAANNLALVLVSRRVRRTRRSSCSRSLLKRTPAYEAAYVTLAKIHFSAGRTEGGRAVRSSGCCREIRNMPVGAGTAAGSGRG